MYHKLVTAVKFLITIIKLLTSPLVWMVRTWGSILGSGTWIKHADQARGKY